jgi:hypothetical protein
MTTKDEKEKKGGKKKKILSIPNSSSSSYTQCRLREGLSRRFLPHQRRPYLAIKIHYMRCLNVVEWLSRVMQVLANFYF